MAAARLLRYCVFVIAFSRLRRCSALGLLSSNSQQALQRFVAASPRRRRATHSVSVSVDSNSTEDDDAKAAAASVTAGAIKRAAGVSSSHQSGSRPSVVFGGRRRRNVAPHIEDSIGGLTPVTFWSSIMSVVGLVIWFAIYQLTGWSDGASVPVAANKVRKPCLDTMKFLAMPLVAAWHMGCTTGSCDFIAFHTRVFCFVSGLVSKSPPTIRSFRSLLFHLVLPIAMYCFVLTPFIFPLLQWRLPAPEDYNYQTVFNNLFKAHARVIWFIIALVFWRLWGFILMPLKPLVRIVLAVGFSAMAGYCDLGDTTHALAGAFKLGNACAFFPVFVAGQLFPLDDALQSVRYGVISFSVGAAMLALCYIVETSTAGQNFMDKVPIQGGWSTHKFDTAAETGLFWTRQLFFDIYAVTKTCVFLLLCCPRSANLMSDLGSHSIYPYLLHVQGFGMMENLLKLVGVSLHGSHLVEFLSACVLCTLLATRPVRAVFWIFLEPTWLQDMIVEGSEGDPERKPERKPSNASLSSRMSDRGSTPRQSDRESERYVVWRSQASL